MKLALLLFAALPLVAADSIAGKWTIDGDVAGNAVNLACNIEQKPESKIGGKCTVNSGDTVDISGDTTGQRFKFTFDTAGYTLTFSGAQDGDAMQGDIEVAGATGTFSGKRTKE